MTNKQTLTVPEPITELPSTIELVGPIFRVMAEASVLIRRGFMFSIEQPPQILAYSGQGVVSLVPGNPEQATVEAANEAFQNALEIEQYTKQTTQERASAAESKLAEETAKAAAKAALAAQIAAAHAQLKSLQAAHAGA